MTLTFKGKTQLATLWSKETGISLSAITSRKARGWSDEEALTVAVFSNDTKITKNDLELELNDTVPQALIGLVPSNIKKAGQHIRRFFPKEFDKYFNEVFKPKKQDELRLQKN